MSSLRSFDAFPKIAPSHTVRSSRGSFSTFLTIFCVLFLTWIELGQFFGGEVDHQFHVDNVVDSTLLINLDLMINMPCKFIHTNVQDNTDDRFLASELLKYEGFRFFIPPSYKLNDHNSIETPDLDEIMAEGIVAQFQDRGDSKDSIAPACHIYGTIPVNKVSGDLHFTAKGYGYRDFDRTRLGVEQLNFTHIINEFSFGEFYPYIHNPLDATAQVTEENLQSYEYYLNVVPTLYKKLGVEIKTNQYSVSLQKKLYSWENRGVPGIFLKYDFDPINLVVEDKRISFFNFIIRLATIYGGIIVTARWGYKLLDKTLILLFGKKFASRGEEKLAGLLDDNEDERK